MGLPGGWELVAILAIVVLLFGGKKIPELAKGIGSGIRNFKKAVKEDDNEETTVAANEKTEQIKASEKTEEKSEAKSSDTTKA